jgi:anthranilate 1,2-dioxygenase small subunit
MYNVTRSPELEVSAVTQEALARLMARYCSAIDNNELDAWPALFTEDCLYQVVTRTDHEAGRDFGIWFCNSRNMLLDRVESIRSVNVFEPHVYRHVLGPTEIVAVEPGVLHCQTSYMVVRTSYEGDMMVFSVGRYIDRVVHQGASAWLAQRVVVTDSMRYDALVALPL